MPVNAHARAVWAADWHASQAKRRFTRDKDWHNGKGHACYRFWCHLVDRLAQHG